MVIAFLAFVTEFLDGVGSPVGPGSDGSPWSAYDTVRCPVSASLSERSALLPSLSERSALLPSLSEHDALDPVNSRVCLSDDASPSELFLDDIMDEIMDFL